MELSSFNFVPEPVRTVWGDLLGGRSGESDDRPERRFGEDWEVRQDLGGRRPFSEAGQDRAHRNAGSFHDELAGAKVGASVKHCHVVNHHGATLAGGVALGYRPPGKLPLEYLPPSLRDQRETLKKRLTARHAALP